jgi:hypothetical protein
MSKLVLISSGDRDSERKREGRRGIERGERGDIERDIQK